jgi:hypothetical protein
VSAPVFELRIGAFRVVVVNTAAPCPWFVWNRYAGSRVFGAVVRLARHTGLSVMWRKP